MGFHDVQFPLDITPGSEGGDAWNTGVVVLDSGAEEATARWSSPKRHWNAAYMIKTRTQVRAVLDFFNARNGAANRFRWRDWMDYASTADGGTNSFFGAAGGAAAITNADQQIGVGTGSLTTFQLKKTYTSGSQQYVRNITKPVAGSLLLSLDTGGGPVNQSSGFSVDNSTGIVTFTAAPSAGALVRAGFLFDVNARFSLDTDRRGITARMGKGDEVECDPIVVEEVPEGPVIDELLWPGGSVDKGVISANFSVNLLEGRFQLWTVNTASLSATMPDHALIPEGWNICAVRNLGSQSIQIKRFGGTNEFSIAAGTAARFALVTQSGVKRWYGI